jgi:UDPglucose--hexose-1-phosphate uridylyltransferase
MLDELIKRAIHIGGFMEMDKNYLRNRLAPQVDDAPYTMEITTLELVRALAKTDEIALSILDLMTPPPSVVNAFFAKHYSDSPKEAMEYYQHLLSETGFFDLAKEIDNEVFANFSEGESPVPSRRFIRMNLSGESWGMQAVATDRLLVFPENPVSKRKHWLHALLQTIEVFPEFEGEIRTNHLVLQPKTDGLVEVTKRHEVENHLLVTLEELSDGNFRIIGYNAEEVAEVASKAASDDTKLVAARAENAVGFLLNPIESLSAENLLARINL